MSSDLKVLKWLEWCTELPTKDHPRESCSFFLKGNEFFFQSVITYLNKSVWYVDFILNLKNKYEELEPINVRFQIGFKKEENLSLEKGEFKFDDIDQSDVNISKKTYEKSIQTSPYTDTNLMLESLSEDFSKLMDESQNHDIEFICEDGKVKAHKEILCCRSTVFTSMLQSDMAEGNTGQVKIQDMNITVFRQFLRCLYTGILPELTVSVALQFYEVGDKYDVSSLKKYCADYLTAYLSPENACDILIVADRHSDSDFKANIIEYIMEEKIPLKGEIWMEFCKGSPVLANEVLNLFCHRLHPQ